ncbi:MAG TPA: glutamate synthase large subunit [Candidatus Limnocylindrales bacterium]|nr:glutamate synthase large subunit [Candidatus Limnocylindrales bacterium]
MNSIPEYYSQNLLYRPDYEHDACGVGFVADISGNRSYDILENALRCVSNLTHRGGVDADQKTGDGAGVLTQIPTKLLQRDLGRLEYRITKDSDLAVGMIFFPRELESRRKCRQIIEEVAAQYGLYIFGWRAVPTDPSALGEKAFNTEPYIEQLLIGRPIAMSLDDMEYERTLYLARKEIERRVREANINDFYIPSFSHKTIVYKGLLVASQLAHYYLDLRNPHYETALAVFHQRYSTNTFPTWFLAQPFRMLAHNGEINTLRGNENWMNAKEAVLESSIWGDRIEKLKPVIQPGGSDSAKLDNVLELLVMSGRNILHSKMMLIPEPWENMPNMDPQHRAFYEYHACITEAWDGPAAIAFSDGTFVGATLDRNGLRPARYKLTDNGLFILASEVGVFELEDRFVIKKGRLGPGEMIAVDTKKGKLLTNKDIKTMMGDRNPYAHWVQRHLFRLDKHIKPPEDKAPYIDRNQLLRQQKAFWFTTEDLDLILTPMVAELKEPVGSMGDDTPLAVLSKKPKLLYSYFKQLFAQVTNPAIDHLREELVMSLSMYLGGTKSMLEETEEHARLMHLSSPILLDHELETLRQVGEKNLSLMSVTLSTLFEVAKGPQGMEEALNNLCEKASQSITEGKSLLILSDRGVDEAHAPIPMLLAVGAVHHHLLREKTRMKVSLLVESGEPREVHHFAVLIGYGASAINPYLTLLTIRDMVRRGVIKDMDEEQALKRYKTSLNKGLLKVMSKMGISTLNSYHGGQIFEAIGLSEELINRYFTGTPSQIGGIGLKELAEDAITRHREAFAKVEKLELDHGGEYKFKKGGEAHAFNPPMIKALHSAVQKGDFQEFLKYTELVNSREPLALRDLLRFKPGNPIPLEEVEPAENIWKRFCISGMSHGALSRETHETLAIAVNRLGAKMSSGEGGEDPARYKRRPNGDWANSTTKQVASGRFGVTPEYLASATKELEIKIAQGSKPGEGGQLPGHKVSAEIAAIRHSVPGVTLISPPPHHDIYSIEDLAQLIYDLKQVNPRVKVSVKLVAEAGVGTIAAGVAKAKADIVQISGHDGGTGASPLSSIKNAGSPWELGLAETQQVLVMNGLRHQIVVRVDGGLKTARDVVIAAMLGAEEYGFGSGAVVAAGCKMVRQCHLNTCPVGVATQDPKLRAKYEGTPEMVVHFFQFLAEDVRRILASLGFRKLDEIIGRTDLLEQIKITDHPKAALVNLSKILAPADPTGKKPLRHIIEYNEVDAPLDDQILQDAKEALDGRNSVKLAYRIRNVHRATGAKVAGEIAYRYGDKGLPNGITIDCEFQGSAGQSFGAFCIDGLRLTLIGEANDYVGKGMHGGEITIMPPSEAAFSSHENTIIGNTVLYGATGGSLYAAGRAGERFAVRNSGALAVIEGVGDHGCEYMTGGIVVVLGETGRNFGAGMTGGLAYVFDPKGEFPKKYNPELVTLEKVQDSEDVATLQILISRHVQLTHSQHARNILTKWDQYQPLFWKVVPKQSGAKPKPYLSRHESGQLSFKAPVLSS